MGTLIFEGEPYILYGGKEHYAGDTVEVVKGDSFEFFADVKSTYTKVDYITATVLLKFNGSELCREKKSIQCKGHVTSFHLTCKPDSDGTCVAKLYLGDPDKEHVMMEERGNWSIKLIEEQPVPPPPSPEKGIVSILKKISNTFHKISDSIASIPLVGGVLSNPFTFIGDCFESVYMVWLNFKTFTKNIGDEFEWLSAAMEAFPDDIWKYIKPKVDNMITTWEESQEGLWEWLQPKIENLIVTWDEVQDQVWAVIERKILANIESWIEERAESILDKVFKE